MFINSAGLKWAGRNPKVMMLLFGFVMSGLIFFYTYWVFHIHIIIAISLAILFLFVYLYLFNKLVLQKEKDEHYLRCKYCNKWFDASESLKCPNCSTTNDQLK